MILPLPSPTPPTGVRAQVLRAIIHAKAREGHNGPDMLIADKNVAIGLRLISSHGFPLLDQSHKFPDYNDRQLNRACQVLRFIDQQTYYTEAATFELLRVFNATDATQRERFRRQMVLGHRREKLRLEQTPLWTVLQLESELALMQRTALRAFLQVAMPPPSSPPPSPPFDSLPLPSSLTRKKRVLITPPLTSLHLRCPPLAAFLQMGLRCERMVARNLFGMIDVNTDSLLQVLIMPPSPTPTTAPHHVPVLHAAIAILTCACVCHLATRCCSCPRCSRCCAS